MTTQEIKFIEQIISASLLAYDNAVKCGDNEMQVKALDVIKYELNKLDENEIKLNTRENYVN